MKKGKIRRCIAGMLASILTACVAGVLPVQAGISNWVIDKSSFETELDTALWNATDDRVYAADGTIVFSQESKKSTALIAKTVAKNSGYHEKLVNLGATMDLRDIPEEGIFVAALGLGGVEAAMGEPGNVEVRFANDGGLKVSVVVFDLDGNKTELAAPTSVGTATNVRLESEISADAVLTLSVNGRNICKSKLPVSGEGRVGFLQTGACKVILTDVNIETYGYERPENCNVYEDFEKESMNINVLTAKMVYTSGRYIPYGMEIKEISGNRVMKFQNMSAAYMGSIYQYSNFELTFDVIGLQRKNELDEEGNIIVPKNENIVVSFGDEAADYDDWGYETSPDAVVFDAGSNVYSMNLGRMSHAGEKGYGYANAECDRDFTIRVSVIDGIVTASMKWMEENEFTEILRYKISDATPLGYVHIWAVGSYTNFSIDNVSLVNKDIDPNLIEVGYKSAVYEVPEDFVYEKIGYVYRDTEEETDEKAYSAYLLIPIVAVVCGMAFGVVCIATKRKAGKEEK